MHRDRIRPPKFECPIGQSRSSEYSGPIPLATQKEELRARLNIDEASARLARFLSAAVELMNVMARACGHTHLSQFNVNDITTWKREMADLSGISYAGVGWSQEKPAMYDKLT